MPQPPITLEDLFVMLQQERASQGPLYKNIPGYPGASGTFVYPPGSNVYGPRESDGVAMENSSSLPIPLGGYYGTSQEGGVFQAPPDALNENYPMTPIAERLAMARFSRGSR